MENSKTRKIVVKLCLVNCELPNSKTTIFDNSKIVIGKYIHIVGSKNKIGMVRAYLIDEGILEPTHNHPSPTTVDISPTPIPQDVLNNLNKSATLFIASMRPESDQVISSGSGGASLKLSSDESVAIISFDYSRLTSMITSKHIHGPANSGQNAGVLFDFDTEIPQKDGTYVWNIKDTGAISKKLIVDAIKNGRTYINLHTSKYPAGEIRGHFVKNNSTGLNNSINPTNTSTPNNSGTSGIIPITIPVAKPQKVEDVDDIVRFLHQSTFGPTEELITKVKKMGMSAFIDEQFNLKPCSHLDILKAQKNAGAVLTRFSPWEAWWYCALKGENQIKQRIVFALSEILVISSVNSVLVEEPISLSAYTEVLLQDISSNYRKILEDVTKNPSMGKYLNLHGSNGRPGSSPNEN